MKMGENPAANGIFDIEKNRPYGGHHIMEGYRNHSGDGIAAKEISQAEANEGFYTKKRRETNEHSNRDASGQGGRGIVQLEQFCSKAAKIGGQFFKHDVINLYPHSAG